MGEMVGAGIRKDSHDADLVVALLGRDALCR